MDKVKTTIANIKLDPHDFRVLAFHAVIVGVQAALIYLGKENPDYAAVFQLLAEAIRRAVI